LTGEDVFRRHDPFESGLDHLLWTCGDNVKGKVASAEILKQLREETDVLLQPHPLAGCPEVLPAHVPEIQIVDQQVGQLSALLHQVSVREPGHPLMDFWNFHHLAENQSRVFEAKGLIEVAQKQELSRARPLLDRQKVSPQIFPCQNVADGAGMPLPGRQLRHFTTPFHVAYCRFLI
jgi:hypothetical protein